MQKGSVSSAFVLVSVGNCCCCLWCNCFFN